MVYTLVILRIIPQVSFVTLQGVSKDRRIHMHFMHLDVSQSL
nr:MAG TPA: hypothetical protein [Caudoviricetes sp.]